MIIPLETKLKGWGKRHFQDFARQVLDQQGNMKKISSLVETECAQAQEVRDLKEQLEEYVACVRVLGDLAQLSWKLVENEHGMELHSPRPRDALVSTPEAIQQRKELIKNELRPRVLQQFEDSSVRKFIQKLEQPSSSSKQDSVKLLIADGEEVQSRLTAARNHRLDDPKRVEALKTAIRPYLQLVESGERDKHTNIPLQDIWRYFRFTWSIPQSPIPGRNLLYLVRDAAHEHHAVIGIAAFSNSSLSLAERDRNIGWSVSGLTGALERLLSPNSNNQKYDPALNDQGIYRWLVKKLDSVHPTKFKQNALNLVYDWLVQGVSKAINEIECKGLVAKKKLDSPTLDTINYLRNRSMEFAAMRKEALTDRNMKSNGEFETEKRVAKSVLKLEEKNSEAVNNSRSLLILKKRAFELSRLLDARRVLSNERNILTDPEKVLAAMEGDEIRTSIHTAMSAIKSQRIGTNILEITTCGAVAPYNHILGGKLVSLLLLSPQIAADNKRRYGKKPAIIRSQLKNSHVIPDNTLVWYGTTSLYSRGSSQYERLRLPAGIVAPTQEEIRFRFLGETSGFGSIQFSDNTVKSLVKVMSKQRGFRDVNSVFGEGASPKLRKLRSGLDAIGFSNNLTMHNQKRRIYGITLYPEAASYLCGLDENVPDYLREPEAYIDATERIADFWRSRWLARRLEHEVSWTALKATKPRLLSSTIPEESGPLASVPPKKRAEGNGSAGNSNDNSGSTEKKDPVNLWQNLAMGGSCTISEGLSEEDNKKLHIKTRLEDKLLELAKQGRSIILTGNAGDGKTHLAKNLQSQLGDRADKFEFIFDATAQMTSQNGTYPIIELWRKSKNKGKGIILAINEYPLHIFLKELHSILPDESEAISYQRKMRLQTRYQGESTDESDPILVDLSLRNPLSEKFVKEMLKKMLECKTVTSLVEKENDPNFSQNFHCLSEQMVQDRLCDLFARVVSSGGRATFRELWMLLARLLFGDPSKPEDSRSHEAWYSERLFDIDPRFPLTEALCHVADPAKVSHPHIDRFLEETQGTKGNDWLMDKSPFTTLFPSSTAQDPNECQKHFEAIKRCYYFEHKSGGEKNVFALDESSHSDFHKILKSGRYHDTLPEDTLPDLIEAINRCYFPQDFDGQREKLYLWIGHRLDEQPTSSFVADEYVEREYLNLIRPKPSTSLLDDKEFIPDHLLLCWPASYASLRIDSDLFSTLQAVREGLPRHLINPSELNRLDTYIDRLRCTSSEHRKSVRFFIYNTEHVKSSTVEISANHTQYTKIHPLSK